MKKAILSLLIVPFLLSANVESGPTPGTYTVTQYGSRFKDAQCATMRPTHEEMTGESGGRGRLQAPISFHQGK